MISQELVEFVAAWESLKLVSSEDKLVPGIFDVGYGHVIHRSEHPKRVTAEEALQMLRDDLEDIDEQVRGMVTVPLLDHEAHALVSFRTTAGSRRCRGGRYSSRLKLLVANFVVDVCFLGILSSHWHLVLRTTPRLVKRMGSWEVARRWLRVFPGRRVLDGQWIEPTEEQVQALAADKEKIQTIRKRLSNISWFMPALSEYVARRANREDQCAGRFWEGRFSCREITEESALLVCGLYVDLNPIRAGEVRTPEEALHTSASFRIRARAAAGTRKPSRRAGREAVDRLLGEGIAATVRLENGIGAHAAFVGFERHRAAGKVEG